jgi:hypothetical protein
LKTYRGKIRKSIGFDCKERNFNASVASLHQSDHIFDQKRYLRLI